MSDLTRDTYNRIAEDWHKDHQQDDWWVEGTDTFISLLPTSAAVLDVGCGAGTKSAYLAEHGLKVTGIDFSENLIAIARRESPQLRFEVMRMQDVAKLEGQFDGIFAQASLLHIPRSEAQKVLETLVSKLADHGLLYVAVKGPRGGLPLEEIKVENDYGYDYERFFSYYSLDELKRYFAGFGLEIVYENVSRIGKTDWIQIIGKR